MNKTTQKTTQVAGAQTLRRGLAILRVLTRVDPKGLRMSEIIQKLGLNKATSVRLTLTLTEEGFLVHDPATGRYRLGPEVYAAGLVAEPNYQLPKKAAPVLRALADQSGDTAFLTVLHGLDTICLLREEGSFPIRNQLVKPGDHWPLGVGAGSCAMLSMLPDEEIAQVLAYNAAQRASNFPRFTDEAIWELVHDTRHHGYCLQPGLVLEDSWAIAVGIPDQRGRPVASISIAAIRSRLGHPRAQQLGQTLLEHGKTLAGTQ
ncbi:IclR family transcriptional regulator [Parapusillimonas granuli]|uniref:IclR family transcriptional regulator n=1 Tax=Parapusillimonas granuli TaxID=380911 RepID=A0A853G1M5_9BURK|nr:IclR family transcriptional regulator [Parapusillimonas granuli]MBB5214662.1 DNA-binding IclR family transcriptional regulator [Parapusillimonas granuli]MEB2398090.1 IclR family transcriptional regulator [Alcaligenaceae bacterium]NYT48930.1 IclR family transcriptional regulator [Parapusillimonas granuli]